MKYSFLLLLVILFCVGCTDKPLFETNTRQDFWLFHKKAQLPIVVEGNTKSKIFLVLLHGGPGGSAQEFNTFSKPLTDILEQDYAMVYYDQRNAGISNGAWDNKLFTIEQHIEDLEKVLALLKVKYGKDITIFLAGHSWGGYLGTGFLLNPQNQATIKAWINIDGQVNRNLYNTHRLQRIIEIGNEQIKLNAQKQSWEAVVSAAQKEVSKNIVDYNVVTELDVTDIMVKAENLLYASDLINPKNVGSTLEAIYFNNYQPFIALANGSKSIKPLITQMYTFDKIIDEQLHQITIPSLFIFGYYDVRVPKQQAEYAISKISTDKNNKELILLPKSSHSPMRSEPTELAKIMKNWLERYK